MLSEFDLDRGDTDLEPDDTDGASDGHYPNLAKEQHEVSHTIDCCYSQHVARDDFKRLKSEKL